MSKPTNPASEMARKRWAKTTPEERKAVAIKLNDARWSKQRKARKRRGAK